MRARSAGRFIGCLLASLALAVALHGRAAPFVYVSNFFDDSVSVIDTATATVVATVTTMILGPRGIAVNAAGTRVYVANFDGKVAVIDTATHTVIAEVSVGTEPFGLGVNLAGTRVYVANYADDTVSVIDTATHTVIATVPVGTSPQAVAVSRAGTRVYVTNCCSDTVSVIDAATNTTVGTAIPVGTAPTGIVINPAGTRAYVANQFDDTVSVIDTATNTVIGVPITVGALPVGVAVNAAATRLYVTNELDETVSVIDLAMGTVIATVPVGFGPSGIALDPGGTRAYVANRIGDDVSVIDLATHTAVAGSPIAVGEGPNDLGMIPPMEPGAPTLGTVTAGNGEATVAFSPPASTGGPPITSYTVTCGAASAGGAGSPITVTGLDNGTAYSCSVTATNVIGTGPASGATSVTPATVPDPPLLVGPAPGDGQATVLFAPPPFDGGSPITGFTATCGAFSVSAPSSPITVTGLVNGTTYSCSVVATNAIGTSAPSASMDVTPATVAGAPTLLSVVAGNGEAVVSFTPPASNGGAAITGFIATCGAFSDEEAASPITVTGLVNGTTYACSVRARNIQGIGPASASANVTPAAPPAPPTVPGAPTLGAVVPGNGAVTVSFTPPASDGGSAIVSYTATCGPTSASAAGSPITVTGLANGVVHSCSVTATNAVGTGPPSSAATVTPSFTVFTGPSATGSGSITASFTGGGAGCSFAVARFIGPPPGAAPVPPTSPDGLVVFPHGLFDFTLAGCTPGASVTFTITYPAAIGAAIYWKYGPTAADPAPHWYVLPAAISGNTATFTIADGGLGDDDLAANGTIVDQGGPGLGAAGPIPTLSEWMLMLLAFSMLGFAMRHRARARV